jgi:hypothetical protein
MPTTLAFGTQVIGQAEETLTRSWAAIGSRQA